MGSEGSMNEESQVRGCYNFYSHQPENSVGSPLNQMYRQQLELLLTDDLLLQGHWGKRTRRAQHTSFNTLDNWGHKTPTPSKRRKDSKEKINGVIARNTYNTLGYTCNVCLWLNDLCSP